MTASTTLMTFMVRTPSTTRTVHLYGSWDNFRTAYPMVRDIRLGKEHWSGCHKFENIVCDGNMDGVNLSRNGGLKMGGTYWYYYKLDDEIEFHNAVEPATTRCPLIPGQLVNELQVPFALSGSRKRDASTSSTSSERRTLDPEAKFVNPRPGPTPPKTLRLNTSPTVVQASPSSPRTQAEPVSAAPLMQMEGREQSRQASARVFHLPRKPSLDALLKARSTNQSLAGRRPIFEAAGVGISIDRDNRYEDIVKWIPDKPIATQDDDYDHHRHHVELEQEGRTDRLPAKVPRGALLLRSYSEEAITLPSFSAHRRQRSRSRSRSRTRQDPARHDGAPLLALHGGAQDVGPREPLSALIEVQTPDHTPAHGLMTGRRIALEALEGRAARDVQHEKRLPTLPNTPSSAYPPTTIDKSPPRDVLGHPVDFNSRFSATTIDTACHLNSLIVDSETAFRFLHFDGSSEHSPSLASSIEDDVGSPLGTEEYLDPLLRPMISDGVAHLDLSLNNYGLDRPSVTSAAISCTTISSAVSTTPTTSCDESFVADNGRLSYYTSIQSEETAYSNLQHYVLPEADNPSEITLKRFESADYTLATNARSQPGGHKSSLSHSEGMQQLLDELSYLSEMISG